MSFSTRMLLEGIGAAAMFVEVFLATHRLETTPRKTVRGPFGPEDDGCEIPAWINVMMAILLMASAFIGGMLSGEPASPLALIMTGLVFAILRLPELPPLRETVGLVGRDLGLFFGHWAAGVYWGVFLADLRWTTLG